MIDRTLSHFRIQETLGSGGMGTVYRAFDTELERTVAVKVLPPHALEDEEARQRFRREARAASALNHPGIVTVHEIGCEDGVDFLVMERVQGKTLHEILAAGPIVPERAVGFALQAAEALAVAHSHGVVHRDLKPGNLMVTPEERVKILDFGLAKRLGFVAQGADGAVVGVEGEDVPTRRLEEVLQTASGMILGTPRYMAPEQAAGGRVDARSDIFAFGCILYRMLAGEPPFEGETPVVVLTRILRDDPVPLRERRPDLPAVLTELVASCLAKKPGERPATGAELLAPLRQAYAELGGGSWPSGSMISAGAPRRSRWRVGLAAAGIAAATIVLGLWLTGRRGFDSAPAAPAAPAAPTLRASGFRAVSGQAGEWGARFSPDGRMLAFLREDAAGVAQVWIRSLAGGDPVKVTSGELSADHLAWSPDGDHLTFARRGEGIWEAPSLGGSARRVVGAGLRPDVDPVGGRLVFERGDGLWLTEADGSGARALPGVSVGYFGRILGLDAAFSPDGGEIGYFLRGDSPFGDLWVVGAEGDPPRRLTHLEFEGGGPSWTPDGRAVVYSTTAGGALNLWWVLAEGGEPRPLTVGAGEDSEPTVAPDGRSVVYTNQRTRFALLRLFPESGREELLLEQSTPIALPTASPDGDRIAFCGPTPTGVHLFAVGSDGSNLIRVTQQEGSRGVAPRWSADGEFLYYYRQRPDPSYARLPADGGEIQSVIDGWSWIRENETAVDAKGERAAYSLWDGPSVVAGRVREIGSGRDWELGTPILGPLWSPDGASVYGSTFGGELLRCPAEGGDCRSIGRGYHPHWGPDGSLYVMRVEAPDGDFHRAEIWSLEVDDPPRRAGEPASGEGERRVAVLEGVEQLYFAFDVLPDGSIVWNRVERGARELWMADLSVE